MANETMKLKYTGPCKGALNRPPEVFLVGYGPIKAGQAFTCDMKTAQALLAQDSKVWTDKVNDSDALIKKEQDVKDAQNRKKKAEADAKKKAEVEAPPSIAPDNNKKLSNSSKVGK